MTTPPPPLPPMDEYFWIGRETLSLSASDFSEGVVCRHFELFFLRVKILLTSSIGGGGGGGGDIKWNDPSSVRTPWKRLITIKLFKVHGLQV